MRRATSAGALYFAIVFLAGFALGVLRVSVLVPRLGATRAVLIELPVILLVAWFAFCSLTARFSVPPAPVARLTMGALAFALLLIADILLARVFGRSTSDIFADLSTASGLLGLAGQILFALL